jgi:hypothetical protein
MVLTFIGIYLTGYFVTLTFLKFFGKKLGVDFDGGSPWLDDFQSNAEAYSAFSLFWFLTVPIALVMGSLSLLDKVSRKYMKLLDKFIKL